MMMLRQCAQFAVLLMLFTYAKAHAVTCEKIQVVTSFTIIADMAQAIAGECAEVQSLVEYGADIHNYQPKPQTLVKAMEADLILWNGLNLELWYERFLTDLDHVPSVIVSEGIEPININSGDYEGKPNPHAWMSPTDAMIYANNIAKALNATNPQSSTYYRANLNSYKQQLEEIRLSMLKRLKGIPKDQRFLVTSEGAFSYLARDMGFKELYLWPINTDQQGTPRQVQRVVDLVKQHQIPVIFSERTVSAKPAKQVAQETNARYGGALYVDSLDAQGGQINSFIAMLSYTIDTILSEFESSQ